MKNKFRILKTLLCVILIIAVPFAFAGCKDKTEKQTEKLADKYLSDRHVEEKYKDSEGKVAFKVDYILPELDESKDQRYSAFNRIMDSIESIIVLVMNSSTSSALSHTSSILIPMRIPILPSPTRSSRATPCPE